ncbi:MAG: class I SAM-dependent methyltransferase, partial [Chloroflexota bacterium]|nr:class I SAM-dependent methyltransferase [Chloroflexota bacterium]
RLYALGLPFGSYTGVDFSSDMLAVAEKKFGDRPNVHFQQLNLITDSLPDGPFDVIMSTWVFSHLPDPLAVVEKALARLRPRGQAIFLFLADPGSWVSPLLGLLLRPFSTRPVPAQAYRSFPHVTRLQTFPPVRMCALAILTAPEPAARQSVGLATREPSANERSLSSRRSSCAACSGQRFTASRHSRAQAFGSAMPEDGAAGRTLKRRRQRR